MSERRTKSFQMLLHTPQRHSRSDSKNVEFQEIEALCWRRAEHFNTARRRLKPYGLSCHIQRYKIWLQIERKKNWNYKVVHSTVLFGSCSKSRCNLPTIRFIDYVVARLPRESSRVIEFITFIILEETLKIVRSLLCAQKMFSHIYIYYNTLWSIEYDVMWSPKWN